MTSIARATRPSTPKQHPHRSLAYRPAIDGLRAFAVVSVIVYHGVERFMPGGWFGVDVFFVISGFLITSLLLSEHRRWGGIHLLGFWTARLRRLLPALFLMLAAVLAAAIFLTPSGRRGSVGGDALATLAYVANWRFLLGDEAYFSQIASPSPLRHTWSLAVEEQYYILFPIVLTVILAWSRRRTRVALVLAGLAALSALLMHSLHTPGGDPNRVYYGTDTRAHELLVGAAIAALVSRGPGELRARTFERLERIARVTALPALLVVISAFWWATHLQDTLFAGLFVPMSVLIGIVLVAAASRTASPTQRLLAWEPLRLIGLISYGLYLWHWPIMVFLTAQRTGLGELPTFALQVLLTVVLASLSYRFVEQPVRKHGPRALIPRVPTLGTVVAWGSIPVLVAAAVALPQLGRTFSPPVVDPDGGAQVTVDDYRPSGTVKKVMLVGNSVPAGLAEKFPVGTYPDLEVVADTNVGCDPLADARYSNGKVLKTTQECLTWQQGLKQSVATQAPDVVVIFVSQSLVSDRVVDGRRLAFGSPDFTRYLEDQLDAIRERVVGDTDRELALVNVACHRLPDFGNEEIKRINSDEVTQELNRVVGSWGQSNDVPVMDQYGLLCSNGYTDTLNGTEIYGDGLHYTDDSAPIFWSWFAPQVQAVADGRDPEAGR